MRCLFVDPSDSVSTKSVGFNDYGGTLLVMRYDQLCPPLINIAVPGDIDKLTAYVAPIHPQMYHLHTTATRDVFTTMPVCTTIQDLLTIRSPAIGNTLLWCPRHDLYSYERLVNTRRLIYDYDKQTRAIKSQNDLLLSNLKSRFTETMQDVTTSVLCNYNTTQLFNQGENNRGYCSLEDGSDMPALAPP
jgi:hypothetical protein